MKHAVRVVITVRAVSWRKPCSTVTLPLQRRVVARGTFSNLLREAKLDTLAPTSITRAKLPLGRRGLIAPGRQSRQIGGDRRDLPGVVSVFERRHSRPAIGDDRAHRLLAPAGAVLREFRAVHPGYERRPRMTNRAGLLIEPTPERLRSVETILRRRFMR